MEFPCSTDTWGKKKRIKETEAAHPSSPLIIGFVTPDIHCKTSIPGKGATFEAETRSLDLARQADTGATQLTTGEGRPTPSE